MIEFWLGGLLVLVAGLFASYLAGRRDGKAGVEAELKEAVKDVQERLEKAIEAGDRAQRRDSDSDRLREDDGFRRGSE